MNNFIKLALIPIVCFWSCNTKNAIQQKTLGIPIVESKFYKLFPGNTNTDVFEGSGVQVVGDYFMQFSITDSR